MAHCDVYADVDFGHGPVEVRCTETGKHEQHRCEVIFVIKDEPPQEPIMNHHNVFEERNTELN